MSTASISKKTPLWSARFQPIMVAEPTVADTIAILRGLKEKYENPPRVRIKDTAIVAAATLSDRYLTDRQLPDKAVDLIDEAASKLRMEIDSRPAEIDEVERKNHPGGDRAGGLCVKEQDPASKERLEKIEKSLADLKEKSAALTARWQQEKEAITKIQATKEQIEKPRSDAAHAERIGDLARAAELSYGTLLNLQKELEAENQKLADLQAEGAMLKEEVDAEDVAEVVAKWSGIPVTRMLEGRSRNSSTWKSVSLSELWARKRRCGPSPMPYGAPVPLYKTPTGPWAPSSSWAPPAWARPNWPGPWPNSCLTRKRP